MSEKSIDIISLEFPENIRTRSGMWVGSLESPEVILREVIDNSIDELFNSNCGDTIHIQIGNGFEWNVISDNGRGIPITWDEEKGITKMQLAIGTTSAGSKFHNETEDISIGANGCGLKGTNALSNRFIILSKVTDKNFDKSIPAVKEAWETGTENLYYYLYYERGYKQDEGCKSRDDIQEQFGLEFVEGSSTVTAFIPDDSMWNSVKAGYPLKSLSYVLTILQKFYNKSANIYVNGEHIENYFEPFEYEFIRDIKIPDHKDRMRSAQFYVNFDVSEDLSISDYSGSINSLIVNRGLHIDVVRKAYAEALKSYFNIYHNHILPGLQFNVICLSPKVDYSSQTKERCTKIDNLWTEDLVPILSQEFRSVFRENEEYFTTHVTRLNEYADSMTKISAINKVKQVIGTVDGGNKVRSKLPSSVKDAASNDRENCTLFITEGNSAGGTLLQARNAEYDAIMSLRGMVKNTINLDLDAVMDNAEMCSIITAIGAGVNEYFQMDNCRYGKVVIAADADVDGSKISSMLLGFFAKKMTFLMESGRVYIAISPLYQQGDKLVYPGEDPSTIIDMSKPFKRYKGLGEINVKEAKQFFFNEETRRLLQITPNNLDYVFDLLTSSYARKNLLVSREVIIDKYNTGIL